MISLPPKDRVDALLATAEILKTPCGRGEMVWQRWAGPTDKPPLVLLHGGFGSWTHWIANVERLRRTRTILTCDMPGLGDSAEAEGELSPDTIAAPIFAGLDSVLDGATSFDLAGFSFGGLIGARVAKMAGARMRSYVAVGASGFEGLHVRVLGIRVPKPEMSDEEKDAIHAENLKILMLWDTEKIDPLAIYTHRKNVARSRVRSRPMSLGNHLVDALPDIQARISGIWGVHDATAGGEAEIMKRRDIFRQFQPDAPLHIIDDAGHWVMYETPEVFEAALLAVLDWEL